MKIQVPLFRKSQAYAAGETINQSLPHAAAVSCPRPCRKPVVEQCSGIWDNVTGAGENLSALTSHPAAQMGRRLTKQVVCDHIITDCAVIHAHNVRAELRLSRQLQAPLHH